MKILVDDVCVCELSDIHKKIIMNDINSDQFDEDILRRVNYVVMHKYEQCLKRFREEWMPKLKELGVDSVPLDDYKFSELVFSLPEYKDRKARDEEEKQRLAQEAALADSIATKT